MIPTPLESSRSSPSLSAASLGSRKPSRLLEVRPISELDLQDLLSEKDARPMATSVREVLEMSGFSQSRPDPRMDAVWAALGSSKQAMTIDRLSELKKTHLVVQKAFSGDLAMPDFRGFKSAAKAIFEECKLIREGEVASYIPQLAAVDPDLFAVSICTVDGQRFSLGDFSTVFSVQSVSKAFTYAMAVDSLGTAAVHKNVGLEPSGRNFNERVLLPSGIPHNPLINTGAIMCSSLLFPDEPAWKRFDRVSSTWRSLTFPEPAPSVLQSTFLAERETACRNYCLAYMMAESCPSFPKDAATIHRMLDEYFGYCSLGVTSDSIAMAAATLANGGLNPISDKRVFTSDAVANALSLMMTCGMYDASGEFSAKVGFPAKSGVSGVIMAVIPGVCGICAYSPRIDVFGNSLRGLAFFSKLASAGSVMRSGVHAWFGNSFEWRTNGSEAVLKRFDVRELSSLWWAASTGDDLRIRQLAARGIDVNESNYCNRTAVHFAISSGHIDTVRLLLALGASLGEEYYDSYISEATRIGRDDIIDLLRRKWSARWDSQDDDLPRTVSQALTVAAMTPSKVPIERYFARDDAPSLASAVQQCGIDLDADQSVRLRALCGKLVIPNWPQFSQDVFGCIPSDSLLEISLFTVDGQRLKITANTEPSPLPIDGIVRIVLYEIAVGLLGDEVVHAHVGKEHSGQLESSFRLNSDNIPYNPFTLSGCLVICALLLDRMTVSEVLARLANRLGLAQVTEPVDQDDLSFVTEKKYADLTVSCLYLLSANTLSIKASATDVLDLFARSHSLRVPIDALAAYAQSLAQTSVGCPSLLALLYSCGLDEISGDASFHFGLPSRTSLSGSVLVIVPGVLGYVVRGPHKGVLPEEIRQFQTNFSHSFTFHLFQRHFAPLSAHDPTLYFGSNKLLLVTQFLSAAYRGDISSMEHLLALGVEVNAVDMDNRTALHVANLAGNRQVCDWLVSVGADASLQDNWNLTPSQMEMSPQFSMLAVDDAEF